MSLWKNSDGLYVKFGLSEAEMAREGKPSTMGTESELVIDLDSSKFPAVATAGFVNQIPVAGIEAGKILRSATLVTTTGFTSAGAATLTIGLSEKDGTTIDADGIDAAIALAAIDTVGEVVACDGALVGTKLAKNSYVTVTVGTAAYTAGRAKLILKYLTPDA